MINLRATTHGQDVAITDVSGEINGFPNTPAAGVPVGADGGADRHDVRAGWAALRVESGRRTRSCGADPPYRPAGGAVAQGRTCARRVGPGLKPGLSLTLSEGLYSLKQMLTLFLAPLRYEPKGRTEPPSLLPVGRQSAQNH